MRCLLVLLATGALVGYQDSALEFPVSIALADGTGAQGYLVSYRDGEFALRVGKNLLKVQAAEIREIRMVVSSPPAPPRVEPVKTPAWVVTRHLRDWDEVDLLQGSFDERAWQLDSESNARLVCSPLRRQLCMMASTSKATFSAKLERTVELPPKTRRLIFSAEYAAMGHPEVNVTLHCQGHADAKPIGTNGEWMFLGAELCPTKEKKATIHIDISSKESQATLRAISLAAIVERKSSADAGKSPIKASKGEARVLDTAAASPTSIDSSGSNVCYLDYGGNLRVVPIAGGPALHTVPVSTLLRLHHTIAPAISPDGTRVAFREDETTIALLNLKKKQVEERWRIKANVWYDVGLTWSSQGDYVLFADVERLQYFQVATRKEGDLRFPSKLKPGLTDLALKMAAFNFHPKDIKLESITRRVADSRSLKELLVFGNGMELFMYSNLIAVPYERDVSGMALSTAGKYVATLNARNEIRVRDIKREHLKADVRVIGTVRSMTFASDEGPLVVTVDESVVALSLEEDVKKK